jgi:hypothetical protein
MVNPKRRKSKDNPYTIVFNNVRNIYILFHLKMELIN